MSNYATLVKSATGGGGGEGTGTVTALRFNGVAYTPDEFGLIVFEQAPADWDAEVGPTRIINKPDIPAAQVPSDWDATTGPARILNKPTIPAAQVASDWNSSEGPSQILNKPDLAPLSTAVQSATNLGDGAGVYKQKVGTAFQFKTLIAGANVSILETEDGNSLVISSAGGGGGGSGVQSITFNGSTYLPNELGNITFSGATTAQGTKADSALQSEDIAPVAISGSYNDLADKPAIPPAPKTLVEGDNVTLTEDATSIIISVTLPEFPAATIKVDTILATAVGQTVFTVPGGYNPGATKFTLDGSTLAPAHYTATNGSTMTLTSGVDIVVGSELVSTSFSSFEVADAITNAQWLSHVGQRGVTQHPVASTTQAGFMPPMPPSDGKLYAFKDGQLVEVTGVSGGSGELFEIEWYFGTRASIATKRPGRVPMDGQIALRSSFPEVWADLSSATPSVPVNDDSVWNASFANKRSFSRGDGSTTFRIPDLNGVTNGGKAYFVRGGAADSFSLKEDMLQNITGDFSIGGSGNGIANDITDNVTGAFYKNKTGTVWPSMGNANGRSVGFDASRVARTGTETAPAHAIGVWLIRLAGGASNPGTVDVTALASEVVGLGERVGNLSCVMSGQIGTAATGNPAITAGNKVPFNEFWATHPDIQYDSPNRRFYIAKSGIYRVRGSAHVVSSTGRIAIGLNTDAPTTGNHRGQAYAPVPNLTISAEGTFAVSAGQYIVFYIVEGNIYNEAGNRYGQFSIERVG